MSESPTSVNIFENPHPEGALPPPWYRPPLGVTKGPTRTRACIVAGASGNESLTYLLIPLISTSSLPFRCFENVIIQTWII